MTVTTDLIDISLAELETDWYFSAAPNAWGSSPAASTDIVLQGTNDLQGRASAAAGPTARTAFACMGLLLNGGTTLAVGQAIGSSHSYNANTATYTVETTDINNTTTNDVVVPPIQTTTDGDCTYFGHLTDKFSCIRINVGTAKSVTGGVYGWQYYNGSTWATLTTTDGTNFFGTAGTNDVTFTIPSDWATYSVNSVTAYYIRAIATTKPSAITTAGKITQAWFGINMTTLEKHLYLWSKLVSIPKAGTVANGGIRILMGSDPVPALKTGTAEPSTGMTNSNSWYVGGSDVEPLSGWKCYVVSANVTPSLVLDTPIMTRVRTVGVGFYMVAIVGGGAVKPLPTLISAARYGTGLIIKDGTGVAPVAFSDINTTDNTLANMWGVLGSENSTYLLGGKLYFGATDQSAVTIFRDTGQALVYRYYPVDTTFYEIKIQGNSTYKTSFRLGDYSPISGLTSNGCLIKGSGTVTTAAHSLWTLTSTDANQVTKLYGCTLSEMKSAALAYNTVSPVLTSNCTTNSTTTLVTAGNYLTSGIVKGMSISGTDIPAGTYVSSIESATSLTMTQVATSGHANLTMTFSHSSEIRGCTFVNSGAITTNGCLINNCTFQDVKTTAPISATYALIVNSLTEMARITNSKFINCNRAIKITTAGTYSFVDLTFSGNAYDIENSSGGEVIINCTGTSNATTYINVGGGSATTIYTYKTLTLTGVVSGSEVRIYTHGTITELAGIENTLTVDPNDVTKTIFAFNYSYVASTYVDIVIHKENEIYYRINNYLLGSTSASLPISQQLDRQYSNP